MAYLQDLENKSQHYLLAYHCIGRLTYFADTIISKPEISKLHTIIEWTNDSSLIRDISTNETWLNGQQLVNNRAYPLSLGDVISLASKDDCMFRVIDLAEPKNFLFPYKKQLDS